MGAATGSATSIGSVIAAGFGYLPPFRAPLPGGPWMPVLGVSFGGGGGGGGGGHGALGPPQPYPPLAALLSPSPMPFKTSFMAPATAGAAAELRNKHNAVATDGPVFHLDIYVSRCPLQPLQGDYIVLGGFFPSAARSGSIRRGRHTGCTGAPSGRRPPSRHVESAMLFVCF
jgi:hypothetical protein